MTYINEASDSKAAMIMKLTYLNFFRKIVVEAARWLSFPVCSESC